MEVVFVVVWHKGERFFIIVPQVVDSCSHVNRVDVVHFREIGIFPNGSDSGVGDQVFIADGVSHAMEQLLGVFEQPFYSFSIQYAVAVGVVVSSGYVAHVVVTIEQRHLIMMFLFIFYDF